MSLNNFYKLRHNFIILGLTGKMQSGASDVVELLTQEKLTEEQKKFLDDFKNLYSSISVSEASKVRRIVDFFNYRENWKKFSIIDYRNVVLLFVLLHNYDKDPETYLSNICNYIIKL